jgi:hypothetical protein
MATVPRNDGFRASEAGMRLAPATRIGCRTQGPVPQARIAAATPRADAWLPAFRLRRPTHPTPGSASAGGWPAVPH